MDVAIVLSVGDALKRTIVCGTTRCLFLFAQLAINARDRGESGRRSGSHGGSHGGSGGRS